MFYAGINSADELVLLKNSDSRWGNEVLRYATEDEKQVLFNKMKEQNLRWNSEEKQIEHIMWRAIPSKEYYCVSDQGILLIDNENDHFVDKGRYKFGNYFRTEEQAKEAAKRIQETLLDYHEELGE